MTRLTNRQREILNLMRDGEELAAYGLEIWCGDIKTSRQLFNFLLRHVLISQDSEQEHYYHINEAGLRLLDGHQDIYRVANGRYVEDWRKEAP